MAYNVFSGTLNPTQLNSNSTLLLVIFCFGLKLAIIIRYTSTIESYLLWQ